MYYVCIEIRSQNSGKHSGELSGTASFGIVFWHDIRARDPEFSATFSGTRPRISGDIFGHATPNLRARNPMWKMGLFRALAGVLCYSCFAPTLCIAPPRHHSYSRRASLYESCNGYDIGHSRFLHCCFRSVLFLQLF